ncbi:MAG: methionine--tRNA ligase [Ignavibacteriaceae bacterium]|nr:methionine--tRNA ligase [Ignavibacteriaceae bacterium]
MSKEKVLVTSALPYANGPIHLGHLSGAYLPADIYVRYKRLNGDDVLYICGSDEHGVPITISADKEKVSPRVIIDRFHEANKNAFEKFGMSFDNYSRTSLPIHHETAKEFFLNFFNRGLFVEKKSNQFYDEKAKMFLPDRYVEGTCPKCGNEQARSDECENCGSLYDPSELKNPKSKVSGETPVLRETTHYFFPLGKYQQALEKYVDEMNAKYSWKENVLQYCRGWFKEGLKDRAITRDLDWGIKVPVDSAAGKVIYVWFEAVLGYISSTKEYSLKKNQPELWKRYWQDVNTKYIAFIGKDNIVFHTIIFPAILMAWNDGNNEKYCLPQNVPANEFLNFEGKKFSKSRNWGIDVDEFLKLFPADPLRYTLAANLPENKDTDFYWKEFQLRNNSELADILGNFINRTFTFVHKHFDGKIPARSKLEKIDENMLNEISEYPERIANLFETFKIRDGVNEMMNLARDGNKYFNDSEPWVTVKSNKEKCATTLNICLQAIFTLAELFYPVMPFSSEKLFSMLNLTPVEWKESGKSFLKEGHQIKSAEILFPKIEDQVIEEQISKLGSTETEKKEDELISYDEFMKTKLKVGEVLSAEKVAKSKKLMKLKVMLDDGERQVIAGIAEHYNPEDLIGKKVVVVANLQPAKLMGEESRGMILAVDKESGGLQVLSVDNSVKNGTRVK